MSETASATRSPIGLADLPGPRGLPLLGNLLQLDLQRLHLTLEQWVCEHGPLYRFQLGRKSVVVVADSSAMFEILRDRPREYRRLGTIEPVMVEMGVNGVFSAEGATWQRQRRIVMQAFHPGHLRAFFPTLAEITGRLVRRWQRSAGEPIDAPGELMRYTVDVTTALEAGRAAPFFGSEHRCAHPQRGRAQGHRGVPLRAPRGDLRGEFSGPAQFQTGTLVGSRWRPGIANGCGGRRNESDVFAVRCGPAVLSRTQPRDDRDQARRRSDRAPLHGVKRRRDRSLDRRKVRLHDDAACTTAYRYVANAINKAKGADRFAYPSGVI